MERKEIFHANANAVISEESLATFEEETFVPSTSDQILVRDAITGISFYAEKAMTNMMLETLTAQREAINSRLSTAVESLTEHIVREIVSSQQTTVKS